MSDEAMAGLAAHAASAAAGSMTVASLSLRMQDGAPDRFAAELGVAFEQHGFAILSDHGIDRRTIEAADAAARAFFALPDAVKRQYHLPGTGGARGYTPFGTEAAKDAEQVDLKEFWHVGRDLPEGHAYRPMMPPNLWPAEVAEFRQAVLALYAAFEAAGLRLLAAIGQYLGLDEGFFPDAVREGNSVLRLLHYPPLPEGVAGTRAAAHEDINVITLLLGAEEAGLEILDRSGRWLPVSPQPGELVVNVGDMLQRLTNGVLRSTTHRVANPAAARRAHARYSMPYFLHFRPDFLIDPLPGRGEGAPSPPISANDYLLQRLREIRLL